MPRFVVALLSLLLAACAASERFDSASAPAGPSVITGSGAQAMTQVAGPPGCAGPLGEYLQVIERDAETGHLNPGVYNRVTTDLEPVKRACAEGREADARNQLASVKARYGYR